MTDTTDAMPQIAPEDVNGSQYVDPARAKGAQKALEIANDPTLTEAQKIDRMAEHRGWFRADTSRIDACIANKISPTDLAAEIAAPIEESYSTAHYGKMYNETEKAARMQRAYHSPEKALELWGPQAEWVRWDEVAKEKRSPENQLWDLWYSILHAAKKIPWDDDENQGRLLDLVKALKARPDPPVPKPMTVPLKENWIYSSGKFWGGNLMLGPSAREVWNDSCGCGAGWTAPETAAWTNVNAFVARLVASDVAGMFTNYGEWALSDLEVNWTNQNDHQVGEEPVIQQTIVTIAAVWVIIAGKEVYDTREKESKGVDGNEVDIHQRGRNFPWIRLKHGTTGARWTYWKRRFVQESEDGDLSPKTRDVASKAAGLIQRFEIE